MAEISVLAPLDGTVVPLEDVPDEVFAQKMVGDGIAIAPSGTVAVAPVRGTLVKLFPDGHAFGVATDDGVELIVHIGLDTVELNGEGFENIAHEGQEVHAGTPIVSYQRETITRLGKSVLSPIVSSGNGAIIWRASGTVIAGHDPLFMLKV